MYTQEFIFGLNHIRHDDYFTQEKGYGFVNPLQVAGETQSEKSIYTGGWNLRESAKDTWETSMQTIQDGITLNYDRHVIVFKVLVPEDGTYKVELKSKSPKGNKSELTIFTGRRNLVARSITIEANNEYKKSFYTYVSPYIPALTSIPCEEKAIYVSITGKHATLSGLTITKKDAPTVFIAGDSTLTDQNALFPYYPFGSCAGWAQYLLSYTDSFAVCNQAHSGMTTNCFRDDGHWDIVKSHVKKDDIVMLQFGHNDQKRRNLAAFGGYIENLRWFCGEIKDLGALPIIVSPISRIPSKDGKNFYSLLSQYASACKEAALECQVPFIDLHTLTFHYLCRMGETAHDFFMPGDITHTNDYGAELFSSYVVSEIERQQIPPLCHWISEEERSAFLPEMDTKELPKEPANNNMVQIKLPYVDLETNMAWHEMELAMQRGLLDPCVMHLHPTEVLPRAQFLMPYLKALRLPGTRPFLGKFCDVSNYEWDAGFVQTCINENLIDETTVCNRRFRPNDPLSYGEFASFLIRGSKTNREARNIDMDGCFREAQTQHLIPMDCNANQSITRIDGYKGLVFLMDLLDNAAQALPSDAEIHPVG